MLFFSTLQIEHEGVFVFLAQVNGCHLVPRYSGLAAYFQGAGPLFQWKWTMLKKNKITLCHSAWKNGVLGSLLPIPSTYSVCGKEVFFQIVAWSGHKERALYCITCVFM